MYVGSWWIGEDNVVIIIYDIIIIIYDIIIIIYDIIHHNIWYYGFKLYRFSILPIEYWSLFLFLFSIRKALSSGRPAVSWDILSIRWLTHLTQMFQVDIFSIKYCLCYSFHICFSICRFFTPHKSNIFP